MKEKVKSKADLDKEKAKKSEQKERKKEKKEQKKEDEKKKDEKASPSKPADQKKDSCPALNGFQHLESAHKALGLSTAQTDYDLDVDNALF